MWAMRGTYFLLRGLVAAGLLVSALVVWWESQELMLWLIHRVGEERALGEGAVIRRPGGEVLLTNPGAMAVWTMPFLGLGLLLLVGGVLLLCPCGRCVRRERSVRTNAVPETIDGTSDVKSRHHR